jgi:hypothetical protein
MVPDERADAILVCMRSLVVLRVVLVQRWAFGNLFCRSHSASRLDRVAGSRRRKLLEARHRLVMNCECFRRRHSVARAERGLAGKYIEW